MKYIKYLGGAVLAGLLALPVTAFAKDKNEGNLMLSAPVQVGSTQLQPGSYKVEWQGSGPAVNVDILQDNKTVVTAAAKVVAYTEGLRRGGDRAGGGRSPENRHPGNRFREAEGRSAVNAVRTKIATVVSHQAGESPPFCVLSAPPY